MVYIRMEKLPRLHEYKYSGVDHSIVSRYILKPFYTNVAIKCFPMSMAPNLITLTGFAFVVVNVLTLLWYNPTLDQDCPPWVYLSWAIGLFLYQTFDAVDGTQARRTGQSGPLGELFDHGVDAVNTSLEVLLFAATMNLGQSWKTVLTLFGTLFTFYVQTWDEYHTHTLTLGIVSGPVEGILTLCIVFAITAQVGGGSFWQQSSLRSLGIERPAFLPEIVYELAWNEWWVFYGGVVLVFNLYESARNVIKARSERGEPAVPALMGLAPFLLTWTIIPIYLYLHPIILEQHLIPFILYAGLVNAYAVGRIVIAHFTKSPFPYLNVLALPLLIGVFDGLGEFIGRDLGLESLAWPSVLGQGAYQVAFLFMCLGLSVGVYGSFVFDVITTICDYLDIWCLTIKHPQGDKKREEAKKQK